MLAFRVTDMKTGKRPDLESIVKKEEWTGLLDFRYKPSFLLKENGELILRDVFGNIAKCPHDRFRIEMIYSTSNGDQSYIYTY